VTHDRRFLENVGTSFYLIRKGQLQEVSGSKEYYSTLAADQGQPSEIGKKPSQSDQQQQLADTRDLYQQWSDLEQQRATLPTGSARYNELSKKIEHIERLIDG
jgi:ATPase subunit of ABC transporter with duplicated ATPase domains